MIFALNVLISACVISFAAWLSGRFPTLAGFMVALPVATLLVLPLAHLEHGDTRNTFVLARSILLALPITVTFFVPFLLADRFGLSFWQAYGLGCAALPLGFLVYRAVAAAFFPASS